MSDTSRCKFCREVCDLENHDCGGEIPLRSTERAEQQQRESDGDLLNRLGDDAEKWATEFCKRFPSVDRDSARAWFANAIEHSFDLRTGRRECAEHLIYGPPLTAPSPASRTKIMSEDRKLTEADLNELERRANRVIHYPHTSSAYYLDVGAERMLALIATARKGLEARERLNYALVGPELEALATSYSTPSLAQQQEDDRPSEVIVREMRDAWSDRPSLPSEAAPMGEKCGYRSDRAEWCIVHEDKWPRGSEHCDAILKRMRVTANPSPQADAGEMVKRLRSGGFLMSRATIEAGSAPQIEVAFDAMLRERDEAASLIERQAARIKELETPPQAEPVRETCIVCGGTGEEPTPPNRCQPCHFCKGTGLMPTSSPQAEIKKQLIERAAGTRLYIDRKIATATLTLIERQAAKLREKEKLLGDTVQDRETAYSNHQLVCLELDKAQSRIVSLMEECERYKVALETIRDHTNSRGCNYDAEIARSALRSGE